MTDEDKLNHLHDKIDTLHGDLHDRLDGFHTELKEHMDEEAEIFDKLHARMELVEADNQEVKTVWKYTKGIGYVSIAVLTIFWADVKSWFGK